jgi:hypothetical protein
MDIVIRQLPVLIVYIASTIPIVSPILIIPIVPIIPIVSPVITVPIVSTISKQLLPDRPEVLIQAYLAEKTAWLA